MISIVAYPKSGTHYTRALIRSAGLETTQTHTADPSRDARVAAPDLHVMRDIRGVVVSAVCHFVLERPELDPEKIRSHVLDVADAMRGDWKDLGAASWSEYVQRMASVSRHTAVFADLVADPRAALLPLVDIGDGAQNQVTSERMRSDEPWRKFRFRKGDPEAWRETLTTEQERTIRQWHAEGLEFLASLRVPS